MTTPPDSRETRIRLPILPLAAAVTLLAFPAAARAQSSHGSIGVSAVILAPPPTATVFVRLSTERDRAVTRTFVAEPRTGQVGAVLGTGVGRDSTARIERLITAGT